MATKEAKVQVELHAEELKEFLIHIVNNNRALQAKGAVPVCVNIEGEAGIGKTSAVEQLAKELGLDICRINLAQIEELGDLVGFPLKEYEVTNGTNYMWVTENSIPQHITNGYNPTGERRMSHAAPEFIQGRTKGGILLLDDYTRADARFMQATMTLIETQQYMSWKLPPDWHIILTTNPDDGNYSVTALDPAQKTRFASVRFKFNVEVWARWAEKVGVDSRCINFLLLHPEVITRDVNPRSVMTFFNSISSIPDFDAQLGLIQMIGEGSVGPNFATMFTLFINNKLDKLTSPRDMLLHENEAYIVGELRNSIGRGDKFRADIASTLATRLINYTINYTENHPVTDDMSKRLIRFCTDPEIFSNDIMYLLVKKIYNANTQKFQKMMTNAEVMKMSVK